MSTAKDSPKDKRLRTCINGRFFRTCINGNFSDVDSADMVIKYLCINLYNIKINLKISL
jgi:hypothetical protein